MNRPLCFLLALCLVLTGCGASGPAEAPESGAPASSPAVTAPQPEPIPEPEPEPDPEPEPEPILPYNYTLCFAGDVSLADGSIPAKALDRSGLEGCIGPELLEAMRNADVMCLNSEFAFTSRGTPQEKNYTFRADPSRISTLSELGVDLAVLANNHVFDYGEEGLLDTLAAFREAGIPYVGAGADLDEASAIWYAELEGCTVAYVAGCRVEWTEQTRGAGDGLPGVFRTAESNELILRRIAQAKETADFVVVYEHWGMEGDTVLEGYQLTSGRAFIDAGADLVVGDHPHVVQGIEWYNGKPIFYSMGNYWFSSYGRYTMLLETKLSREETGVVNVRFRLIPAWTEDGKTTAITDSTAQRAFYDYMEGISPNAAIDDGGVVTEAA